MSKSKVSANSDAKRKSLRAIGINPYKGVRKLNHDQKSYIARLFRKYGELATEKKSHVTVLSTKSTKIVRAARESGYLTYRNKIVVHKEGAKRVRISGSTLRFEYGNGKTKTALVSRRQDWQKQIDAVKARKLGPNEYVTGKFFDHSPWHQVYKSVEELERYIVNFTPHDEGANKDKLLAHLSIIRIDAHLNPVSNNYDLTNLGPVKPLRKVKTKRGTKTKGKPTR